MWNKPQEHNAFVVTVNPRIITCSILCQKPSSTISLQSHHTLVLDNLELEKLFIFNPTKLASHIRNYYRSYSVKTMPVFFALNGPSLYVKIISVTKAHPNIEHFNLSHAPHWMWDYSYLYSYDHRHYFYVCGIKKSLLLQYQLLSINAQLPLRSITTEHMALLQLYRHIFGSAFRHSQLGTALSECNNNIEQLFSKDDLSRVLSIPGGQDITNDDYVPLLTACGLFVSQRL